MLLGYALAVLAATTVVCLVMGAPTVLPDKGNWGSFYRYAQDLPMMFVFGLMMTALYGLPGWLVSVITAEIRDERRRFWFAAAGFLTALLALFLASRGTRMFAEPLFGAAILAGGLAGGLAYWAVIGKRSGNWKNQA